MNSYRVTISRLRFLAWIVLAAGTVLAAMLLFIMDIIASIDEVRASLALIEVSANARSVQWEFYTIPNLGHIGEPGTNIALGVLLISLFAWAVLMHFSRNHRGRVS